MLRNVLRLLCIGAVYAVPAVAEDGGGPPAAMEIIEEAAGEALTLQQAIDRALAGAPRMRSAAAAVKAGDGAWRQAGMGPNPELGVEVENFAGRGNYRGFEASEITLGISQTLEMGGKRASRKAAAGHEAALRRFEYEAERLDLIRDVTAAYAETVAAQESLALSRRQQTLAESLQREVARRVDAAREPLVQRSKADIALATATLARDRAAREFDHARHTLAGLWGGHHETFTLDRAAFTQIEALPGEAEVESALERNPALRRFKAEEARARARLDLEKAQAVPDPRVNVGLRDFRDTDEQALVAGVSIPIPVANRNQGHIAKARAEMARVESDAAAVRLALRNAAFQAREDAVNAYEQARSLKDAIIPAAERAFALAREGYGAGRLAYLEVIDARRTLFEAESQYIDALKDYHKARAELDRAAATHLSPSDTERPNHDPVETD